MIKLLLSVYILNLSPIGNDSFNITESKTSQINNDSFISQLNYFLNEEVNKYAEEWLQDNSQFTYGKLFHAIKIRDLIYNYIFYGKPLN